MALSFATLPEIRVTWAQVTPAGGDTFENYNLHRRLTGATAWTRIATATLITTLQYDDYEVASGQSYDYAISATYLRAGLPIESAKSSTVAASCTFTGEFLHDTAATGQYAQLLVTTVALDVGQEQVAVHPWGQGGAVVYIGQAKPRHWMVSSKAQGSAPIRDMTLWNALASLLDRQYANASVLCYRSGYAQELAYVVLSPNRPSLGSSNPNLSAALRRQDQAVVYLTSFELQEIVHSIAV